MSGRRCLTKSESFRAVTRGPLRLINATTTMKGESVTIRVSTETLGIRLCSTSTASASNPGNHRLSSRTGYPVKSSRPVLFPRLAIVRITINPEIANGIPNTMIVGKCEPGVYASASAIPPMNGE